MNNNTSKTSCKRGFTLIELLVVVLIIGILAAVALPQYKLAVAKTKLTRLFPLMESVRRAEDLYYLSNGSYIDDFEALDIQMPAAKSVGSKSHYNYEGFSCYFHNTTSLYCVQSNLPKLETYWGSAAPFVCWASDDFTHKVCRSLVGKNTADVGTTGYLLHGSAD